MGSSRTLTALSKVISSGGWTRTVLIVDFEDGLVSSSGSATSDTSRPGTVFQAAVKDVVDNIVFFPLQARNVLE